MKIKSFLKFKNIRRLVQILFLLFFVFLFIKARYPYTGYPDSDFFLRFSPILPLFELISDFNLSWIFWPALLIILLTPLWGRFFCGWICPLGTTLDVSSKVVRSPSNKNLGRWTNLSWVKYAILVVLVLLAFGGIQAWGFIDPLSLFNRVLTVVLFPSVTLIIESSLNTLSEISFLEDISYAILDWFKEIFMPENQLFSQQVLAIALFFLVILGFEKISRRFWCRNICPVGAWLGLLSRFRLWGRSVSEACTNCGICQIDCKMGAISRENCQLSSSSECIQCMNCKESCPTKFSAIGYRWKFKPVSLPLDLNRRRFIWSVGGGLAAWGILGIGLKNKVKRNIVIRPPGSLPENEFLEKCIRCMECVRICSTNGACLQPSAMENSFLQLWTPVAVMRQGYCEYNCNLCGEVCPTNAILPLKLEQKQKTPMGLAYFDKNLCIPYARNIDCLVCEEHCPLPEKAIKFDLKEAVLPDRSTKIIKYPYVDKNLCIGCGICETKCPIQGKPGIFIISENEQRLKPQQVS